MITPIDKMSVTDKVIDSLRSYIQEPSRCEGEKLPTETELSQRLGVGRSTVREALRVLQTMGYVKIVHGKGAFIQSQSPSNNPAEQWIAENYYTLNEIYSVREILEPPMAALASEKATVQECEGLLQLVSDLGQALNAGLATAVGAEILEGLKYVESGNPYENESGIGFVPDSVEVLAPEAILDTITEAPTVPVYRQVPSKSYCEPRASQLSSTSHSPWSSQNFFTRFKSNGFPKLWATITAFVFGERACSK